jgi:hypothetical protein
MEVLTNLFVSSLVAISSLPSTWYLPSPPLLGRER